MPLKGTYNPGQSGSELTGHVPEQQGGTYMNREPAKKGQLSPQDPRSRTYQNLANQYSETSFYSTDTMLPANDGNDVCEESGVQGLGTDIYEVADQNKTTQGSQQKLVDTGLATLEDLYTTYGNGDSCPGSRKNSMCMYGNADSPRASCSDNGQALSYKMALKSSGNLSSLKPDTGLATLEDLYTTYGNGDQDPRSRTYHNLANKNSETSSYSTDTMLPANDGNDVYAESGVQGLSTDIYEVADQNKTTQSTQQKLVDTGLATLEDLYTTYGNGDSCPGLRKNSMCMHGNADSPRASCSDNGQAFSNKTALKSSGNLSPLKPDPSLSGNSILAYDNRNNEQAAVQGLCTDIYEVADQNKTTQGSQQKLVDTGLATLEDLYTTYGNGDSCPGSRKNSMCMYGNADSPRASGSDNGQAFTYNMALKSSGNLSPLKPDHSITGNSILAYDNLNKELKLNSDVLTTVFGQSSTDPEDTEYIYGNAESREASRNNSLVGNDNRESGQANGNSLQTSFTNSIDFYAVGISSGTFSEDYWARFQMGESNAGNGLDIHHLSTDEIPNVSGNASTSAGLSEEAATKDMTFGNGPSRNGSRHASAEQSWTEVSNRDSSQALSSTSQQDGSKAEETLTMGPYQTPYVSATATRKSSILGDATANLPDQYPTSDKSLQPSNACPALSDGQGQASTGNVPVQCQRISSHAGGKSLTSAVSQGGTPPPGSPVSRTSSSAAGFSSAVGFQRGKMPLASISNEVKQLQPLPVGIIPTSTTSVDDVYAHLPEPNEAQEEFIEPYFSSEDEEQEDENDGVYGTIN